VTASKLRKYNDAVTAARANAGYDDIVTPVRGLPLVSAGYENERTDIHGFTSYGWSGDEKRVVTVLLSCYCGHDLAVTAAGSEPKDTRVAEDAAFELFVDHARAATLVSAA
jgi:hypothetical protein